MTKKENKKELKETKEVFAEQEISKEELAEREIDQNVTNQVATLLKANNREIVALPFITQQGTISAQPRVVRVAPKEEVKDEVTTTPVREEKSDE